MRHPLSLLAILATLALPFLAGCGESGGGGAAAVDGAVSGNPTSHQANACPHVAIDTSRGQITVKLNEEKAPLTVANFLRYVDEGYYTDTLFHEVRQGDVIVGGGYTRDLQEKPTNAPPVRNEAQNGVKNTRGTIAMVRSPNVIDSSTSQFLFNLAVNDYLDPQPLKEGQMPEQFPEKYGYCVFGEVVSGQEVLDEIAKVEVADANGAFSALPKQHIVIKEIRRLK